MIKKAVKLADVAKAAGVDTSTVSRVLNRDPRVRVSAATKEQVLAAARKLGYTPNAMARGLRTARTSTLAFVVPQIENPVFTQMFVGAVAAANARGYDTVLALVESISGGTGVYERLANTSRVDGLLVATAEPDSVLLKELQQASVPYVVVNRKLGGVENCVAFDNIGATRNATEYLLSLGHRRIAHIAGTAKDWNGERRMLGWRAALKDAGVPVDRSMLVWAGYTFDGGLKGTRTLLAARHRPTAVLAATTLSAAGALAALHGAGLRVPEDVSVVGVHDADIAQMVYPALTTVALPVRQLGEVAANGLIDILQGTRATVGCVLESHEMRFRASTGPAGEPA